MQRHVGRLILFSALLLTRCLPDYATMMQKAVKKAVGGDFSAYRFFSYPTNNFGVGTAYDVRGVNEQPSDDNYICTPTTPSCLDISQPINSPQTAQKADLTLGGIAAVGEGGTITLSHDEETNVTANLLLPKIYNLLQLGAGTDVKHGVTTNLVIDEATVRKLDRNETESRIKALPDTNKVKQAFGNGSLAIVIGDVMISAMRVSICVDTAVNPSLNASLSSAVGKVLGDPAKLQVGVTKDDKGCYSLEVAKPVIVAALAAKQHRKGVLMGEARRQNTWNDFTVTRIGQAEVGR
jgi:hypothetical protein